MSDGSHGSPRWRSTRKACPPAPHRSSSPSENPHRGALDLVLQHRVKPVARRHVRFDAERLLEKELDADKIDQRETARGIVLKKKIKVAVDSGLVPGRRPEQIERRRAHRLDGVGVPQQLGDGVGARHGDMVTRSGARRRAPGQSPGRTGGSSKAMSPGTSARKKPLAWMPARTASISAAAVQPVAGSISRTKRQGPSSGGSLAPARSPAKPCRPEREDERK